MGEEIGAEVWLERAPLKYDGLSLHRDLDLRSAGADGPRRAAGEVGRVRGALRERRRSKRRSSASSSRPAGWSCKYGEQRRRRSCRWSSCTTAGRRSCARRCTIRRAAVAAAAADEVHLGLHAGTAKAILGSLERRQQGMGHSPIRSRSARRQRRQAAGRRRRTTARATRRSCGRCSARGAASSSPAA